MQRLMRLTRSVLPYAAAILLAWYWTWSRYLPRLNLTGLRDVGVPLEVLRVITFAYGAISALLLAVACLIGWKLASRKSSALRVGFAISGTIGVALEIAEIARALTAGYEPGTIGGAMKGVYLGMWVGVLPSVTTILLLLTALEPLATRSLDGKDRRTVTALATGALAGGLIIWLSPDPALTPWLYAATFPLRAFWLPVVPLGLGLGIVLSAIGVPDTAAVLVGQSISVWLFWYAVARVALSWRKERTRARKQVAAVSLESEAV